MSAHAVGTAWLPHVLRVRMCPWPMTVLGAQMEALEGDAEAA
jgi:hypothetical protein